MEPGKPMAPFAPPPPPFPFDRPFSLIPPPPPSPLLPPPLPSAHLHHHHLHHPLCPFRASCRRHHHFPSPLNPNPFYFPTSSEESQIPELSQTAVAAGDGDGLEEDWSQEVEEEGEEDVFVLTDEWTEFFAKSEAKRRLEKKKLKQQGKGSK